MGRVFRDKTESECESMVTLVILWIWLKIDKLIRENEHMKIDHQIKTDGQIGQ